MRAQSQRMVLSRDLSREENHPSRFHLQAPLMVMAEEHMVWALPDGGPGRAQLPGGVALGLLCSPAARGVDHLPHHVQVPQLLPRQGHLHSHLHLRRMSSVDMIEAGRGGLSVSAGCTVTEVLCHGLELPGVA